MPSSSGDVAWTESFDGADPGNVLGLMNHWWGSPDWWSVPGQVTLTGKAGEWWDAGVMQFPGGPEAGNGYGTWSFDFNPHGATVGDYLLLWSSADVWPHGEYDVWETQASAGETDLTGVPYSAIHYPDANGNNDFTWNGLNGDIVNWEGLNTISMTWAEDASGKPYVSVTLNGQYQYTQYDGIDHDLAHGGPDNRVPSIGQQFGWNRSQQSGDNSLTVTEVRYVPIDGAGAPPTSHPDGPETPVEQPPAVPSPEPPPHVEPSNHSVGSGPDSLVLRVSQDYYGGNAQYAVLVDGERYGDVFTASALHGSGSDLLQVKGDWAAGEHLVTVELLNDAYDDDGDRNLYVTSATYNGVSTEALGETWWGGDFLIQDLGDGTPPAEQPPAEQPPVEQPPVEQPPAEEPPVENPPEQPPAEQPRTELSGGNGKDTFSLDHAFGVNIDAGGGKDTVILGADHGDVHIFLHAGEAKGDVIKGFDGGAGDMLHFVGFGDGAELQAMGGGRFRITDNSGHREAFTVQGHETLHVSDFIFA